VMWSDAVTFTARDATLCSIELLPDAAADATEAAFTFPALRFEAMGSYVAKTGTETCADAVIGEQLVTRFVAWGLRNPGDEDTFPSIAEVANFADDFRVPGQVLYFENVAADTPFDVIAVPFSALDTEADPAPTALTVQPCVGCTP
jgi:hypothetical protein